MQRRLKERLIGAAVLVLLAVIFIPMLLNDTTQYHSEITGSNIPPRPVDEFNSRIVPLEVGQSQQATVSPEVSGAGTKEAASPTMAGQAAGEQNPATGDKSPEPAITPPSNAVTTPSATPAPTPITGNKVAAAATPPAKEMGVRAWIVQLGSFSSEKNAEQLNKNLRSKGFTAFVEPLKQKSGTIYRVRVGPELLRSDAEKVRDKIKQAMHMDGLVVSYP